MKKAKGLERQIHPKIRYAINKPIQTIIAWLLLIPLCLRIHPIPQIRKNIISEQTKPAKKIPILPPKVTFYGEY